MQHVSSNPLLVVAAAAVFGAFIGSALLCAAQRWAAGQNWVTGRSHCTSCNHTLGPADLVPVFSFLARRGKCAHCGAAIPKMCLWAELASAATFGILAWRFGLSPELGMWAIFALVLLALSFTDLEKRIIPNKLLLVAAANRLVWLFALGQPILPTLSAMAISAAVPAILLVVVLAYERLRKVEAMGMGDIKLMLVMALYLNWVELLVTLVSACILGLVGAKAKLTKTIPFGPALAAGCILAVTLLHPVVQWYGSFF